MLGYMSGRTSVSTREEPAQGVLPGRAVAPGDNTERAPLALAAATDDCAATGSATETTLSTSAAPDHQNAMTDSNGFDPHAVWRQLQSELAIEQGGSFDRWVHDTWVIAYEDGEFLIGLPDAFRYDWIVNRLSKQIKRKLAVIVGRSTISVKFRVQARPTIGRDDTAATPLYGQAAQLPLEQLRPDTPPPYPLEPSSGAGGLGQAHTNGARSFGFDNNVGGTAKNGANGAGASASEEARPDARGDATLASLQINPRHTFANFVVGNHNKLAHAVAEAVAERPGTLYNPLFVYGGVGLGKTHLLHAITIQLTQLGYSALYCTSEQFTNDLIAAIRHQTTDQFRAKYRHVDALLIDDIQFISGKESTQEEFFHTFNHLHAAGKQIIISSDRPPKSLATLEERLRSRFEGGIQTDIQTPDFETRVAILQSKAQRQQLQVPHDVLMLLAERVDSNVRELEGALNNLWIQAQLHKSPLTISLANMILNNLAPQRTPCPPARVIEIVAEYYKLTSADLMGRSRTAPVAFARHIAMYLLREENGLSLPAIGDQLGGRDHTTVRHGVEKVTLDLEQQEQLRRDISTLRERLYIAHAVV
jgi:chromosomal replication initiator protein